VLSIIIMITDIVHSVWTAARASDPYGWTADGVDVRSLMFRSRR
jgi:hypothetical protein